MHCFQPVDIGDVLNGQSRFGGNNMMLITAGDETKANTMTASWGGFGYVWNKYVATIYVRESRYTRKFLDEQDTFSLSFLDYEEFRRELKYLGMVSGRDEDKIAAARLNIGIDEGVPYIDEASNVILCKKLFSQKMEKENILIPEIVSDTYKDDDMHIIYIGEITKVMIR